MSVRARIKVGRRVVETNLSPFFAKKYEAEVLDEPTENPDGSPRRDSAKDGRPLKAPVSVDEASAANKKAASASTDKEK